MVCGPALPSPPWTHGAGRETQPAGARWAPCPHGASWGRHRQVAEGGTAKDRAAAGARVPGDWPEQQSSGGFSDSPERPGHPALSPPVVGAAVAWHASRPPAPGSPASGAPACTQAGRQSRGAWGRGSHAARARPRPAEFAHVTQPSPASTSRLSEAGGTAPPSQGQARCPREQCDGRTSHAGAPCVAVSLGPASASRTAQLPAPRSLGPGLVPTGRSKPGTAVTSGSGFALSPLGVLENHRSQERGGVCAFERLRIPARQTDAAHEVAVSADNAQSARPSRLHGAGRRL